MIDNKYSLKISTKQHTLLVFLLLAWVIRITILQYGNENAVVTMNPFVVLQIFIVLCMAFLLYRKTNVITTITKIQPLATYVYLYFLGVFSAFWSIMPLLSGFFAMQNVILISALFCIANKFDSFDEIERNFLLFNGGFIILRMIRSLLGLASFHELVASGTGAAMLCYCLSEKSNHPKNFDNYKYYKYVIYLSILAMILGTSSGANVSFACGILALSLFAKNKSIRTLGICIIFVFITVYLFGDFTTIISMLFPGKSEWGISTASGRTVLWAEIFELSAQRPLFGWGFATVERLLNNPAIDSHNSFVGVVGGLGYVGAVLLIYAMLYHVIYLLHRMNFRGIRGLFSATICLLVNSNTYGFLTSKATWLTLVYFQVLVLSVIYLRHSENNACISK